MVIRISETLKFHIMDNKKYINANKTAWEEVNALHQEFKKSYKKSLIEDKNYVAIHQRLLEVLNDIGFKDKHILQLCCNDGEELISLRKLGAGSCTGVDISEAAIASARELNDALGLDCRFYVKDVHEIEDIIHETFDIVLITVGALVWLPDLELFFEKAAGTMCKNATLIIQEQHPFSWIIDEDMKLSETDLYFEKGPYEEEGSLDYLGNADYRGSINYTFNYTLSELINAQIKNNLQIERFEEYPYDISNLRKDIEDKEISFPLSYICISTLHEVI